MQAPARTVGRAVGVPKFRGSSGDSVRGCVKGQERELRAVSYLGAGCGLRAADCVFLMLGAAHHIYRPLTATSRCTACLYVAARYVSSGDMRRQRLLSIAMHTSWELEGGLMSAARPATE